jgi:hypothetical protein
MTKERRLPSNVRFVHHVAGEEQPWFLKLYRRCLGGDGLPSSEYNLVDDIRNPNGEMGSERDRLIKKGLKLSKLRLPIKGSKKTKPAVEVTLVIYDPPGTPEDQYNAPMRIGVDGKIHEKPIFF